MDSGIIGRLQARRKKVFYGWWIVVSGMLINAFGVGTFFYGFSTFFNPLIAEFGWTRTAVSGVFALSRLEGGIEGPIVGWLIDKFGARRILLVGITLTGIGYIALSQVNSLLSLYLIFGLLLSMGFNIGYSNATQAAIAKWFIKKRGRALSLLITGNGLGGAIFVPLIALLITRYDWRSAAVIIGVATLAIPLPLSRLIRSNPEDIGEIPDGRAAAEKESSTEIKADTEVNFTVREALKTRAFWVYAGAMLLRSAILSAIVVHEIPHLTDIGIPYQQASNVLGLMVMMSVPGRFIFGWLGDRYSKKLLVFLLCLVQAVGIFIFINANTTFLLYLFVVVYGLGYGGVIPLTISMRADLFGRAHYATIAGISMSIATIGAVSAPIFAGYLYDTTQSYSLAFYVFIAMIVVSGTLFLFIPKPAPPKRLAAESIG